MRVSVCVDVYVWVYMFVCVWRVFVCVWWVGDCSVSHGFLLDSAAAVAELDPYVGWVVNSNWVGVGLFMSEWWVVSGSGWWWGEGGVRDGRWV